MGNFNYRKSKFHKSESHILKNNQSGNNNNNRKEEEEIRLTI